MPKRIQVFEDSVYVITYDQKVMTFNKFASTGGELLLDGAYRASDILILHPLKQKRNGKTSLTVVRGETTTKGKLIRWFLLLPFPVGNPCAEHPCEGQHICLLSSTAPLGRTCKCDDDFVEVRYKETNSSVCNRVNVDSNQCRLECNQGHCHLDARNRPRCVCSIDFEGEFCERYRCSGYCKNRGICYVDASRTSDPRNSTASNALRPPLKCKCAYSWTGDRCEISASKCRDF